MADAVVEGLTSQLERRAIRQRHVNKFACHETLDAGCRTSRWVRIVPMVTILFDS